MSGVCYSYILPIGYPCWECNDGDTTWCYVQGCEKVRKYGERMREEYEEYLKNRKPLFGM